MSARVTLKFSCHICHVDVNANLGKTWRQHLLTPDHQRRTRSKCDLWTSAQKKRGVIIVGIRGMTRAKLLRALSESGWTFIDVVFWNSRCNICLVEFPTKIACGAFLASTPFLLGRKVLFLARTGLSKSEWTSIRRRRVLTKSSKIVEKIQASKNCKIVEHLEPWILKRMKRNPTTFAFIKHDLENFWGYRAHMFNSLLWENLFGIQLCEIEPRHSDSSQGDRYPKLKAIMTFNTKIESLAHFLVGECGKERVVKKTKFSKLKNDKCNEFLESLKSGKLVPAQHYSCDILEGWSPYALLTFDIEIAGRPGRASGNLPSWVLSVKNITCRKLRYVLFLSVIRRMFSRLWRTFISWMLDFEFSSST